MRGCPSGVSATMDNDDLFAAFVVLAIAVLLYTFTPSLSGVWVP